MFSLKNTLFNSKKIVLLTQFVKRYFLGPPDLLVGMKSLFQWLYFINNSPLYFNYKVKMFFPVS